MNAPGKNIAQSKADRAPPPCAIVVNQAKEEDVRLWAGSDGGQKTPPMRYFGGCLLICV